MYFITTTPIALIKFSTSFLQSTYPFGSSTLIWETQRCVGAGRPRRPVARPATRLRRGPLQHRPRARVEGALRLVDAQPEPREVRAACEPRRGPTSRSVLVSQITSPPERKTSHVPEHSIRNFNKLRYFRKDINIQYASVVLIVFSKFRRARLRRDSSKRSRKQRLLYTITLLKR